MTPDEVIKKLEEKGIKTSRSTILRFENQGLIPTPNRGSDGRGKGRYSEYSDDTPHEYIASYVLLNKPYRLKPDEVAKARSLALKIINKQYNNQLDFLKLGLALSSQIGTLSKMIYYDEKVIVNWFFWWTIKLLSENNIEIPKSHDDVYHAVSALKGIDMVYDKVLEEVDEYKKRKFRCLWEELISLDSKKSLNTMLLHEAQKELNDCAIGLANVNKVYNSFENLNENEQKYLNRITKIYKRRKSLIPSIEAKIKQIFPQGAELLIDILQKQVVKYKANSD